MRVKSEMRAPPHLVGEEAALLSLVDELRQLNQAVRVTLQAAGHTQGGEREQ